MPDEDMDLQDEEEVLEATSRHSKKSATPPHLSKSSVRQDLKLMYQNMTSVTPTSQLNQTNYSILQPY